jgi:hypothetical protein
MPFAINVTRNLNGLAGAEGSAGADGDTPSEAGGNGGAGSAGRNTAFTLTARDFVSNAAADSIFYTANLAGGNGGSGGFGGRGADGPLSVTTGTVGRTQVTTVTQGPGGDGGAGGSGGRGGSSTATFSDLSFALGGGSDAVGLTATARGGNGGWGVLGNTGGVSGPSGTVLEYDEDSDGLYLSASGTFTGAAGGDGGASGNGAGGGNGTVRFADLAFGPGQQNITLGGTAFGGAGGGVFGQPDRGTGIGGGGTTSGTHADAGNGGAGGSATAEVVNLSIAGATVVNLFINLQAWGGNGGAGADAVQALSYGRSFAHVTTPTVFDYDETWDYLQGGDGGDGGRGGSATARMANAAISLGDEADAVNILLLASAGRGGAGGAGAPAIASSTTTSGASTTVIDGAPAGADGLRGLDGVARVTMTDNVIQLGGGNDQLTLDLRPMTDFGRALLTFTGNRFEGGAGVDTLAFSGSLDNPGVLADVFNGTLRIGNSPTNIMTGFERFFGTLQADRFIDGAGDQFYDGVAGADRFEFRRNHGHDTVVLGDGVVRLLGFGLTLDSFADLLARATEVGGFAPGVIVATGANSSLMLSGLTLATLDASDFLFA